MECLKTRKKVIVRIIFLCTWSSSNYKMCTRIEKQNHFVEYIRQLTLICIVVSEVSVPFVTRTRNG